MEDTFHLIFPFLLPSQAKDGQLPVALSVHNNSRLRTMVVSVLFFVFRRLARNGCSDCG